MNNRNLRTKIILGTMAVCMAFPAASFAAEASAETAAVAKEAASQSKTTETAKEVEKPVSADTKKLQERIKELEEELKNQNQSTNELLDEVDQLYDKQDAIMRGDSLTHGYPSTSNYLVEPGWNSNVGYTQDAINAQGDSTMVFSYSTSQLYKIYCKLNYLTDIALKPGEPITFVGGGDTGQWMLDTSTLDGTAHLYLKPIAKGAKTNLIINTLHHSYQILCQEGDWYNPMVKWSYGTEDIMESVKKQQADSKLYTATVAGVDRLNFDYRISGDASWKPTRVFDDGTKTFIQFDKMAGKMPVLGIREKGKTKTSLVNYHTKNNCIIVDRTFTNAELRSGDEVVKIRAGK